MAPTALRVIGRREAPRQPEGLASGAAGCPHQRRSVTNRGLQAALGIARPRCPVTAGQSSGNSFEVSVPVMATNWTDPDCDELLAAEREDVIELDIVQGDDGDEHGDPMPQLPHFARVAVAASHGLH
jgi:hypothetical protein